MKVYVFGNQDLPQDRAAFTVVKKIKSKFPQIKFIEVGTNMDLPLTFDQSAVIMDGIEGINDVVLLENKDLDRLLNKQSSSVHDFDLGFQLKYLKKLRKIGRVRIIGIPKKKKINYLRIQSILRKLVAQDMQGS